PFSQHVPQRLKVQRLVRNNPLQPPILLLQLLQLPSIAHLHPPVLPTPPIKRLPAHTLPPADLLNPTTPLRFPKQADDLLLRKSTLPHHVSSHQGVAKLSDQIPGRSSPARPVLAPRRPPPPIRT